MSLITWSCYVQNLSRQVDETNNWGHLEFPRTLFDSRKSRTFYDSRDYFSERFPVLRRAIYTNQVTLSAEILMSRSKLLELLVIQSGECWEYYSRWIVSASRSLNCQISVSCFCFSRTKGLTCPDKDYPPKSYGLFDCEQKKLILTLTALCEWPVIISVCDRSFAMIKTFHSQSLRSSFSPES